jgi:hypothetical protein
MHRDSLYFKAYSLEDGSIRVLLIIPHDKALPTPKVQYSTISPLNPTNQPMKPIKVFILGYANKLIPTTN